MKSDFKIKLLKKLGRVEGLSFDAPKTKRFKQVLANLV